MKGTRLYRKVEVYYLPWTLLFYFWFPKHNFMLNTLRIKVSTDHIPSLTKLQLQNRIEQMDSTYSQDLNTVLNPQMNVDCTIANLYLFHE